MPTLARVTPEVLHWARERAQLGIDVLANKVSVRPDRIVEWESGAQQPTFRQA